MNVTAVPNRTTHVHASAEQRRSRRVVFLLAMIILLSLADLIATVTHLQTIGMIEANPVAAWIIQLTGSSWSLASFKGLSVLTCVILLYRVRHRMQGEVASWFSVGVLMALAFYWGVYTEQAVLADRLLASHPDAKPEHWMILAGPAD